MVSAKHAVKYAGKELGRVDTYVENTRSDEH